MPVYNTEKFVWEAIESILNQTFQDFEFIIIDDCSTDNSWNIVQEYSKKDGRIVIGKNEENMGISYTRNKLIALATTNYIASQDSDDISLKNRLELCVKHLEQCSWCAVVSWNNIIINEDGITIWYRQYNDDITKVILKKSPISQPSSLFRKNVFDVIGWYGDWNYWEDYDLWLKMYAKWYQIKNLNISLLKLRIRKGQTKSDKLKQTIKNTIKIQGKAIQEYRIQPSLSDLVYILLEHTLLLLPASLIIKIFQKITY